jgi:hypothetical protein
MIAGSRDTTIFSDGEYSGAYTARTRELRLDAIPRAVSWPVVVVETCGATTAPDRGVVMRVSTRVG